MTYRRGGFWWASIRFGRGRRKRVSLGTKDKPLAEAIERTMRLLYDRREWEILEAAVNGPLSPGEVYDYWIREELGALRARLNDVDLQGYVSGWQKSLEARVSPATASKYLIQLRTLIPEGAVFLRSELSRAKVKAAMHELEDGRSGGTVRRYVAAWSSFFEFLVEEEILGRNPARGLRLPRESKPRERHLSLDLSVRLVAAQPKPYRALAALREGAGVEIGAALGVRRRDINRGRQVVHVRGTKDQSRDRLVFVDDPFWAVLEEHSRNMLPDAPLWPGITADSARHYHRLACAALEIEDYRMHDARHSYAVRHMKAGDPISAIANNLGHKDASMVLKVYGKYTPKLEDFRRVSNASGDGK